MKHLTHNLGSHHDGRILEVQALGSLQKLAWAVVVDAYRNALKYARPRSPFEERRLAADLDWFQSHDDHPFSFPNCCHIVGIEAGYLWRLIKAEYQAARAGVHHKQLRHLPASDLTRVVVATTPVQSRKGQRRAA